MLLFVCLFFYDAVSVCLFVGLFVRVDAVCDDCVCALLYGSYAMCVRPMHITPVTKHIQIVGSICMCGVYEFMCVCMWI